MHQKNKRIDLQVVAKQLDAAKRLQNDHVAYEGEAFDTAMAALFSALELSSEISDSGRQRIIRDAIFSFGAATTITADALRSAVARHEATYLRLPQQRYAILTSISAKFTSELRNIREAATRIRFYRDRPRRFARTRFEEMRIWPKDADTKDYASVVISVNARTTFEAAEHALRDLDFYRGIWNFSFTRHTISRSLSSTMPLADVSLGRVHTVHRPGGAAVGETFWYQPTFFPQRAIDLGRDWPRVMREEAVVRRKIRSSSYPETMKEVFVRYARALDGVDFDSTYLKLWSLFELLTATSNARYDQSIGRALFVFEEQELNRAILEHLREYRNATVHSGISTDLVHDFCWQLKQFVDALIRFHLSFGSRFKSWGEAATFLDLPRDTVALKQRIAVARRALKYRGG